MIPVLPEIVLEHVRFDDATDTLLVQARLGESPDLRWRDRPIYVGVTAVTPDGREIDLVVQELFPGGLDAPFLFTAEVGEDVEVVLLGAWDTKVEPCGVDRSGCREFGFVLDGPLASWPPGLYTEGVRQRIPPAELVVRIEGGKKDTKKASKALDKTLEIALLPFGTAARLDTAPPSGVTPGVTYAHPADRWLAIVLAEAASEAWGEPVVPTQGPVEGADIRVAAP